MSDPVRDMVMARFYTVADIQTLFRFESKRQVYRAAGPGGFLAPFARRFQERHLLFDRQGVDRLIENGTRR